MSSTVIKDKWNRRYAGYESTHLIEPTPFVVSCLPELPEEGLALDIAAGAGRHSLALARRGLRVDAVDIAWRGVRLAQQRAREAKLYPGLIQFAVIDLELPWLPHRQYDVILVAFFLYRPLIPLIKDRLRPGGYLLYETRVELPPAPFHKDAQSNSFWLTPRELLASFSDLEIVRYDEGQRQQRSSVTAQLLAQKAA